MCHLKVINVKRDSSLNQGSKSEDFLYDFEIFGSCSKKAFVNLNGY